MIGLAKRIESIITELYNGAIPYCYIRADNKWRKVPNWSRSSPVSRETGPLFWANEAELIVVRRLTWRFCQREHDEHLLHFPFTSERAAIYRPLFSHQPESEHTHTAPEPHVLDSPSWKRNF